VVAEQYEDSAVVFVVVVDIVVSFVDVRKI
jgi:hypothetical protein